MKAKKAIKILTIASEAENFMPDPDFRAAVKLSIEALKRHVSLQVNPHYTRLALLPGETPDDK